jgi:aspartyl-tRNA(Asn)/glutamyl-tRNA(Gln) amidotransferase subunit A
LPETLSSFSDLQASLRYGRASCADVVDICLSNIEQQQTLNAWLSVYADEAKDRARDIDKKIRSGNAGPLAGLVVGIKDVLAYRHHPLQAASKILEGFQSVFTATVVQRLLDADAIIIGRQNCDEFAMGSANENSAYGPVRHAADPTRVPGGSSGGSAVAVQAHMCHVSIGSDTGGSVRQPAAFCGVYGLKPTYGRISRHGLVAYASSFDCVGILARHLTDIATVLQVVAGPDNFDSTASNKPVPRYSLQAEENNNICKIAYLQKSLESPALQPEIKNALLDTIASLRQAGHQVEAVEFPLQDYLLPTYYVLATAEASSNLSRYDGVRYGYRSTESDDLESLYKKTRSETFGKEVQRRILLGTYVLSASYYDAYYHQAQKVRRLIREHTQAIFSKYDFLLTPTTPTTAFPLGTSRTDPTEIYLADIFSVQANVCGMPAISVPCGNDSTGLPIGLQLMANDFEEAKLLRFSNLVAGLA